MRARTFERDVASAPCEAIERGDTLPAMGSAASPLLPEPGYQLGERIGSGGMGEVIAAHDRRIGRDVALKRMHAAVPCPETTGRFLREARIQDRLDHPAIVPVHELGTDADGRPYFTMKRLAGVTLAKRLEQPGAPQPLLRAFVDVCLAVQYAHERCVVHRDLKPSNIMLGDYGEVYVLDWGIACVTNDPTCDAREPGEIETLAEGTKTGDVLGTPGYMAPEQVRGERVGAAVDVYALGAVLFEILAGEPLHRRGAHVSSALTPAPSPASRCPDRHIAPELDAACHAALGFDPAARPTARELGESVQRYLDGDRDIEGRRALARELLASARAALASGDPEARASAMRDAGHALTLDPKSVGAAQLVSSMIVEPPPELPAELVARLCDEDNREALGRLRIGVLALLSTLSFLVLLPWMRVRNWDTLFEFFGAVVLMAGLHAREYVRGRPTVTLDLISTLVLSIAFSRIIGPFILTPIALCGVFIAIAANPRFAARPWLLRLWIVLVLLAPLALERVGLLGPTWTTTPTTVQGMSQIFSAGTPLETFALIAANIGLVVAVVMFSRSVSRRVRDARRRLTIQRWHLGQLVPAVQLGE
jgi:serine/threonine-protein kinase